MKQMLKRQPNLKRDVFVLVALILAAAFVFIAVPVSAQDPDVEAAQTMTAQEKFTLRPYSAWMPNSPLPMPTQKLPESGRATTELLVTRAGNVSSISIAFDYNSAVAGVAAVRPGTVFDGLTEGVDYIVQTTLNRASPINPNDEMSLPPLWPANDPGNLTPNYLTPNRRTYVNISIINPTKQVLYQNGSLIKIDWSVATNNPGSISYLIFSILDLKDVSGNSIAPCFGFEDPCLDLGEYEDNPVPLAAGEEPIVGLLEIDSRPLGLNFQVALQGLNVTPAFSATVQAKFDDIDILASQFGYEIPGYVYDDGRAYVPVPPPYESLSVERPGYLKAQGSNIEYADLYLVTLLAGDVNNDNVINIFDLTLMANALGSSTFDTSGNLIDPLERMDYTGNSIIDIADLALVAGNFRIFGPTPIR